MRSLSLWSALLVCTLSVHSYILIHTRTVVGYLQSGLFRWLELRSATTLRPGDFAPVPRPYA